MKVAYPFLILIITITKINAQSLYFPPTTGSVWDTTSPQSLNWCQRKIDSLYTYLETNNTKAFILLKDGKIVLEKYFGSHAQNTPWQWASAGKTITSFMVGIAQQENYLSIDSSTSKYLGQGWTNCTPVQENNITVRNQLAMTSGLDDGVADPTCTIDSCLFYKADAGSRWAYHNAPYTLLDKVINNATGITLNSYTNQKLKTPTGITGSFFSVGNNNVFFSNARSMARFGLLMLNKGNWNGNQIMTDTTYFNQMVNTSQSMNEAYGYLWWLNGKQTYLVPGTQFVFNGFLNPNAPADMYVAMGKDGQFLNVVPSLNLVWIRMGESPDNLPVPFLLNDEIWKYINDLECNIVVSSNSAINNHFKIFPNPTKNLLSINSNKEIAEVEVFNVKGQFLKVQKNEYEEFKMSIAELQNGLYFLKIKFKDGSELLEKIVKK